MKHITYADKTTDEPITIFEIVEGSPYNTLKCIWSMQEGKMRWWTVGNTYRRVSDDEYDKITIRETKEEELMAITLEKELEGN